MAVAIGLRTATGGAVTGIEETSLRALAKLEQVLPPRLRSRVNTIQTVTLHVRHRAGPTVDPAVLTELAGACRDHSRLRFDYADRRGDGHAAAGRAVPPRQLRASAGTSSRGTPTAATGARSASTGSVPGMSRGPRFVPRDAVRCGCRGPRVARRPVDGRRYQARITVHPGPPHLARPDRSVDRHADRRRRRVMPPRHRAPTAWRCWPPTWA